MRRHYLGMAFHARRDEQDWHRPGTRRHSSGAIEGAKTSIQRDDRGDAALERNVGIAAGLDSMVTLPGTRCHHLQLISMRGAATSLAQGQARGTTLPESAMVGRPGAKACQMAIKIQIPL
ncbi:hypothetical protein HAX54_021088 [Datura stramonium]|uniref:Uncharacterized protein n=1 Tax=Datura stramonium TaxID=4076 RepID=A0ABS8US39_DATST|nr:hypothetical protein [Datura stramonium]